ncbi:hypothetical protein NHX12_004942, partial [Muraenolepis orangiensis]
PVSPVGLSFPGDFAVLLKAGMTVRQAILYNALSALMAFLGMAVGILIGHYADHVSMWVFALTAGLFMYAGGHAAANNGHAERDVTNHTSGDGSGCRPSVALLDEP